MPVLFLAEGVGVVHRTHVATIFSTALPGGVEVPVAASPTLLCDEAAVGGDVRAPGELAYNDVANAWRTYLAKSNKGRPFVLIGHSQGALTARYAAARRPDLVASVTSVAGTNHGSELADYLQSQYPAESAKGRVLSALLRLINALMSLLDTGYHGPGLPVDIRASHASLTTAGVALFNEHYPQGLPQTWGGQGPEEVGGVRYYSWSGTLQPGKTDKGRLWVYVRDDRPFAGGAPPQSGQSSSSAPKPSATRS